MGMFLTMFLLSDTVIVAGGADDEIKAELKKLQGTWVVVSTERDGVKRQEPRTLYVFEGDRAKEHFQTMPVTANPKTWTFSPNSTNHLLTLQFKLDPSQSPKAIDERTQYKDGKTSTKPTLGIYKLENDTLTICCGGYRDKGKRPQDFTAAEGSGRRIEILKREKP